MKWIILFRIKTHWAKLAVDKIKFNNRLLWKQWPRRIIKDSGYNFFFLLSGSNFVMEIFYNRIVIKIIIYYPVFIIKIRRLFIRSNLSGNKFVILQFEVFVWIWFNRLFKFCIKIFVVIYLYAIMRNFI